MRLHISYAGKESLVRECRMFSVYNGLEIVVHYENKPQENIPWDHDILCITSLPDEISEESYSYFRVIFNFVKLSNMSPEKVIELLKAQKAIREDYSIEDYLEVLLKERKRKR